MRKEQLEAELPELRARCQQQELEISNLENQALRQRFQEKLDNMLTELLQKEQEVGQESLLFCVKTDTLLPFEIIFYLPVSVSRVVPRLKE